MARKRFDYERYVRNYEVQEAKANRAGYLMNERMLTEREAYERYRATRRMLEIEVKNNERGSIGNVYQYMVRDQAAPNSWAMAKAIKRYSKETGQNVKLKDILYTEDIKTIVDFSYEKQYRDQLKAQGLSWVEIDKRVSHLFFGSPE